MSSLFHDDIGAAIDGKFRYKLWRIWDRARPLVLFVMLNPSTADASFDDPTLRRCISIANELGFGGLYVGNLFAFRSTDPKALLRSPESCIGDQNDDALLSMRELCHTVIFAWGNFGSIMMRDASVVRLFPNAFCLGQNSNGSPKHPLYIPNALVNLKPFKIKQS